MQAQTPEVSTVKATTGRIRPPPAGQRLDLPSICDICGNARSARKHGTCSRIRQRPQAAEWAASLGKTAALQEAK